MSNAGLGGGFPGAADDSHSRHGPPGGRADTARQQAPQVVADPVFLALDDRAVHAALRAGKACPVSCEVGRLMLAYIETFLPKAADLRRRAPAVSADRLYPIEAISLNLASSLFNDRELLTTVGSLLARSGYPSDLTPPVSPPEDCRRPGLRFDEDA